MSHAARSHLRDAAASICVALAVPFAIYLTSLSSLVANEQTDRLARLAESTNERPIRMHSKVGVSMQTESIEARLSLTSRHLSFEDTLVNTASLGESLSSSEVKIFFFRRSRFLQSCTCFAGREHASVVPDAVSLDCKVPTKPAPPRTWGKLALLPPRIRRSDYSDLLSANDPDDPELDNEQILSIPLSASLRDRDVGDGDEAVDIDDDHM
jgi:hypothetical protein